MKQEVQNVSLSKEQLDVETLSNGSEKHDKLGEVGMIDAPDGGRAAWSVIFGCFCVNTTLMSCIPVY